MRVTTMVTVLFLAFQSIADSGLSINGQSISQADINKAIKNVEAKLSENKRIIFKEKIKKYRKSSSPKGEFFSQDELTDYFLMVKELTDMPEHKAKGRARNIAAKNGASFGGDYTNDAMALWNSETNILRDEIYGLIKKYSKDKTDSGYKISKVELQKIKNYIKAYKNGTLPEPKPNKAVKKEKPKASLQPKNLAWRKKIDYDKYDKEYAQLKCEQATGSSGIRYVLRKVKKDHYLTAIKICNGKYGRCSWDDSYVMKTQGLEFSGSTMINQPIFLQPTKKEISVKDNKGFDKKYVIYEESTACAVSGFILMAEERALERAKRFKQSKTVQRELASILNK